MGAWAGEITDATPDTPHAMQGAPLHVRTSMLSSQLTKAVQIMPASQPADTSRSREMSFAEKRRLSQRLGQVQQPALLEIILEICSADAKVTSSAAEEVEVEIDDLRPETLWKLQELVDRPHAFAAARAAGKLASTPPPNTAAPEKRPNVSVQSSGAFCCSRWDLDVASTPRIQALIRSDGVCMQALARSIQGSTPLTARSRDPPLTDPIVSAHTVSCWSCVPGWWLLNPLPAWSPLSRPPSSTYSIRVCAAFAGCREQRG
jgi:hypothetical protein